MAGNFIGLWILYLLGTILVFFGMGAMGLRDETLWEMLALSALLSLMTSIYIKLTELHARQTDMEKKLDALLAQQKLSVPDNPETSSPDRPQD